MLKPFVIITCFIIFSAFTFKLFKKGISKNDLKFFNIKGRVKSCTEYNHEINDPKFYKVFNLNIKQTITTNFYNREGYRTKIVSSTIDKNGKVISYSSNTYDAKVRQAKASVGRHTEYNKSGQPSVVYNEFGQRDTCYVIDKRGELKIATIYHYDKNHNQISVDNYYHEDIIIGKPVYKTLYRYNKDNNLIEEIDLDAKGKRASKKTFSYDSRGNVLLEIDSAVKRIGNSNSIKQAKNNSYTISNSYKNFDKAGNWLQKITVVNNERSYNTKRKINYYN